MILCIPHSIPRLCRSVRLLRPGLTCSTVFLSLVPNIFHIYSVTHQPKLTPLAPKQRLEQYLDVFQHILRPAALSALVRPLSPTIFLYIGGARSAKFTPCPKEKAGHPDPGPPARTNFIPPFKHSRTLLSPADEHSYAWKTSLPCCTACGTRSPYRPRRSEADTLLGRSLGRSLR